MSYVGSLPLNISLHRGNPQLAFKASFMAPGECQRQYEAPHHLLEEFEGKDGGGITGDKLIVSYSFHFISCCLLFNTLIIPALLLLLFQGGVARTDSLFLDKQIGSSVQTALSLTTEKHISL